MGGLISSLGNLFGGSAVNTDRQKQLQGFGNLENVFNFGMNQGSQGFKTGANTEAGALEQLGGPAQYYQKLLTGNRAAAMSAIAPTVNAINSQTDASARQASTSGTARGGGVNAANQQIDTAKQGAVENAITGARENAAGGATKVAGEEGAIGGTQLSAALNLLGLGERAATASTELAGASRAESNALHRQKAQDVGQLVNMLLGAATMGGGVGAGSATLSGPGGSVPIGG